MESQFSDPDQVRVPGAKARFASRFGDSVLAGHLASVLTAANQETVWSLTTRFLRDLGFAHAFYGYSPDSRGARLGSPDEYQILSTLAPEVMTEMVECGHYRQSTTFHWALHNAGLALWSMTAEECGVGPEFVVDPTSQEFFLRNHLLTGCTIGFPNERTRGNAVMALVGPPGSSQDSIDQLVHALHDVIFVVGTVAHRTLMTLPFNAPRGRLTQRQREVLEWVAEGKTSADIATIMGISPPTVEKHLRLARETLGVDTTAHALIKAAFLNQVFVAIDGDGVVATGGLPLGSRPSDV
ncbi:MAG: autoinducer binding domain-containing protein [Rhodobacter sp.]|nr:autoinducer binding domain-containing protein [Paracoccaceae bacterium]MCC0075295.1 autoinducer binding domain-containing protein [Rhodobacter sp.]